MSKDPRDCGFYMPAEWQPHSCCWMAWPSREGLWDNPAATRAAYARVANAIARFEPVKMLVRPGAGKIPESLLMAGVEIVEMPIDDSWTRNNGPNFLINDSGQIAGSTWTFNAWGGKYAAYHDDALVGSEILRRLNLQEFSSALVAEGGGVTVDGEGTVVTTESCLLNPNRNPGWSKQEVERELCRTLGAEKIIWLPGDPEEKETDGHVDGIASFVEPGRLLMEINDDTSDPHYSVGPVNLAAMRNQTDARGRTIELAFINEGHYHPDVWNGGCSSYINAYLANGAVIVPGYGYDRDAEAVETWKGIYPDRQVVLVEINDIAIGGGGVHCITQQQPATLPET